MRQLRLRRITLTLTLLLTLAMLVAPTQPAKACDYCMAITYDQAYSACYAVKRNHFTSCLILGGWYGNCLQEANAIFDGCMRAHGF